MNRTATTEALKALIAAHAAEIAALKVENEKLAQRVVHLEEQLRLERLHRYAPRSEKLTERIFNEAEQAAAEGEATEDVEAAAVADTGCRTRRSRSRRSGAASRCLKICRASASSMTFLKTKGPARAAGTGCTGWARP
jgi:hypothetical protein